MSDDILKINQNPKTLEEALVVIQQLIGIVIELKKENVQLRAENAALKAENAELKEKLRINSTNSSLPPSKDLRRPKTIKKSSARKQGGQPGHPGVYRALLSENEVNQIIDCKPPETCDVCNGTVEIKTIQRHQVYEAPQQHFEVIEYRKHRGICQCCKKKHEGQYPVGISDKKLGHRAHGLIGLLTSKFRLSKRLVVDLFKEVYGLSIGLGTVSNVEKRVSDSLCEPYREIEASLKTAPIVHVDETGHKEKNKNGWAWVMSNESATLFSLQRSRGKKIAHNLIGSFLNRIFVTDRYPAYDYLPDGNRQVCWAHLKRDFKKISERDGPSKKIGLALLKTYRKLFHLRQTEPIERRLNHKKTIQWFRRYKNRMMMLIRQGATCGNKNTVRTCQNLLDIEPALWTFWYNPDVPPTNNHAERQLRPLVISKKLTFGTQSTSGSRYVERIFTAVMSCQQQKRNIFQFLEGCVSSLFTNQPAPKLLQSLGPA
jgi:transposase